MIFSIVELFTCPINLLVSVEKLLGKVQQSPVDVPLFLRLEICQETR